MYEKGKTSMVDAEMKRYNISLLGITQTRYIKSGTFRLATGETRLNSGYTHDRVLYTTGRSALIGWEPVSSRLITATFRTTTSKDTHQIYDVYAPSNDASEEVKDQFYERLKNVLGKNRPQREQTISMREMITKIESCNTGYKEVICTHGFGEMNNNGKRFADICAEHKLVIGGAVFHTKDCIKSLGSWTTIQLKTRLTTCAYQES